MLNKIIKVCVLMVFVGSLTACGISQFYHKNVMRGQVVGIDNDEVVVCIGTNDGAKVGQELQVTRFYRGPFDDGHDEYIFENVGVVKITSVVNEHFARAKVLSGAVKKHDAIKLIE